jgi:hypothetical protein
VEKQHPGIIHIEMRNVIDSQMRNTRQDERTRRRHTKTSHQLTVSAETEVRKSVRKRPELNFIMAVSIM